MTFSLHPLGPAEIRALHAGQADWATDRPVLAGVVWPDDDRRVLRYRVEALDTDPDAAPYLLSVAVLDERFAGRIGCHEAPSSHGRAEIGYAVAAAERGRGIGGLMVELFCVWLAGRGVIDVDASVGPDNEPSLRLLRRRGFVETGERWDEEDGRELVLSRQIGRRESDEDRLRREATPPAGRRVRAPTRTFEAFKKLVLFYTWLDIEPLHDLADLMSTDSAALPVDDREDALPRAIRELRTDGLLRLSEDTVTGIRDLRDDEVDDVLALMQARPVPLLPYSASTTPAGEVLVHDVDL